MTSVYKVGTVDQVTINTETRKGEEVVLTDTVTTKSRWRNEVTTTTQRVATMTRSHFKDLQVTHCHDLNPSLRELSDDELDGFEGKVTADRYAFMAACGGWAHGAPSSYMGILVNINLQCNVTDQLFNNASITRHELGIIRSTLKAHDLADWDLQKAIIAERERRAAVGQSDDSSKVSKREDLNLEDAVE
jgi:hypothetical protein